MGKFITDQILGMKWLNTLIGNLLGTLGLDATSRIGGSIQFFLYDVIKITVLLCVLIYLISYIQSYFPPERSKKIMGRFHGIWANCIAALLGTVTPFCSCSSIPLFIGFTSAGLPLGVTFSFLISSPMVDLGSLVLLMSIFGAKVAILYVVLGLVIAVAGGTLIEKPHSFSTACNVATQIIAQVASNQYGGQSISLSHLAPFVEVSRQKIRKQVEAEFLKISSPDNFADPDKVISDLVEERVREEVKKGVQTIQYQVITLMTTNGQAPFITVFMYLNEVSDPQTKKDLAMIIEEVVRQRYQGVKNEKGVWTTPAFPKLIYVLEEDNITEDSPYWYLTQLCAKCSAKRLVPDYISEKKMREYKLSKGETEGNGDCYTCMGCRSFLTPDRSGNGWDNVANAGNYQPDKPKYYGRFNQGVVTINLPDVALSALKVWEAIGDHNDIQNLYDTFWEIFDERLELCHKALQIRHERLSGTLSDASPIHWQYGALARLKKGETIDKLLHGGYSTISLGYAGLYECVMAMTGKSHTDPDGEPFALKVMQYMNDKCAAWKAAEDIDYSLYGTPIESTTYKFAKCLQKRFGVIEGITDKGYITNSYHVHVTEHINAFDKLRFESQFQKLSPGGAISYIEVANLSDNIPAILTVLKYIYDNIMYAELNTKSDYCQVCGWDKEIEIVDDDRGKLIWKCPNCGNTDKSKMNIARRTCGYIGLNDWNQGRTQEIKERYVHLGGDE